MKHCKVAHIIHDMKVGGVENAARYHLERNDNYKIFCLGGADLKYIKEDCKSRIIYKNPNELIFFYVFRFLFELYKFKADLLLSSLWRSHFVAFLVSFFFHIRWVSFFHSANFFHFFDKLSTKLSVRYSSCCLCDSSATKKLLLDINCKKQIHIIDFYFKKPTSSLSWFERDFKGAYFGRLSSVKNLPYLFDVISEINQHTRFSLDVFGDGEDRELLKKYISDNGLSEFISLKGAISPDLVFETMLKYKFYFQASFFEGQAVSVMQAMDAGCCCFVTFVGEIKNYASNLVNAIMIPYDNLNIAASSISDVVKDDSLSLSIANNACSVFANKVDFSESLNACLASIFYES